jgi:hypothetical protein
MQECTHIYHLHHRAVSGLSGRPVMLRNNKHGHYLAWNPDWDRRNDHNGLVGIDTGNNAGAGSPKLGAGRSVVLASSPWANFS